MQQLKVDSSNKQTGMFNKSTISLYLILLKYIYKLLYYNYIKVLLRTTFSYMKIIQHFYEYPGIH